MAFLKSIQSAGFTACQADVDASNDIESLLDPYVAEDDLLCTAACQRLFFYFHERVAALGNDVPLSLLDPKFTQRLEKNNHEWHSFFAKNPQARFFNGAQFAKLMHSVPTSSVEMLEDDAPTGAVLTVSVIAATVGYWAPVFGFAGIVPAVVYWLNKKNEELKMPQRIPRAPKQTTAKIKLVERITEFMSNHESERWSDNAISVAIQMLKQFSANDMLLADTLLPSIKTIVLNEITHRHSNTADENEKTYDVSDDQDEASQFLDQVRRNSTVISTETMVRVFPTAKFIQDTYGEGIAAQPEDPNDNNAMFMTHFFKSYYDIITNADVAVQIATGIIKAVWDRIGTPFATLTEEGRLAARTDSETASESIHVFESMSLPGVYVYRTKECEIVDLWAAMHPSFRETLDVIKSEYRLYSSVPHEILNSFLHGAAISKLYGYNETVEMSVWKQHLSMLRRTGPPDFKAYFSNYMLGLDTPNEQLGIFEYTPYTGPVFSVFTRQTDAPTYDVNAVFIAMMVMAATFVSCIAMMYRNHVTPLSKSAALLFDKPIEPSADRLFVSDQFKKLGAGRFVSYM